MKRTKDYYIGFIIGSLIIGLILSQTDCVSDDYYDTDPLYGTSSRSCEFAGTGAWLGKSFGVFLLMQFGIAYHEVLLKHTNERDNL